MAFRVEITSEAKQDANAILEWLLAQQAGERRGLRWFQELKEAIATLSTSPKRCSLARENAAVPFEMRQLLYGRRAHVYRILFTIEADIVYVSASGTVAVNISQNHISDFGQPSPNNRTNRPSMRGHREPVQTPCFR
jgi:plasmid stabilization system protein ParE